MESTKLAKELINAEYAQLAAKLGDLRIKIKNLTNQKSQIVSKYEHDLQMLEITIADFEHQSSQLEEQIESLDRAFRFAEKALFHVDASSVTNKKGEAI